MSTTDIQNRINALIAENRNTNVSNEDEDLQVRLHNGKHKGTTRTFREEPFAWWEKKALRYLRKKYGTSTQTKRQFNSLRNVYLAICEMDSDFRDTPIKGFTKTVGTYAGMSRQQAGKYLRILEDEGLIRRHQVKDEKTGKFLSGTVFEIVTLND